MTGQDNTQVMARLDALERRYEANTQRLFERLDAIAEQGHGARLHNLETVRLPSIEKRLDGLWGKVMGLMTAISAAVTLLWSLLKSAAK